MLNVNYISMKPEKLWHCQKEPSGMALSLQRMEVAWTQKKACSSDLCGGNGGS